MTTAAAISKPRTPRTYGRPRWLTPVIVVVVLMTSALALTVLATGPQANTDDLDPANPGFNGAQGLAHVLSNHGVKVSVVRSQRELLDQSVDANTTVAITSTASLSATTARAALAHTVSAASLVLLDADPEVTKGMGLPVDSHLTDLTNVTASCRGTVVGKDIQLAQADRSYTPTAKDSTAKTCFPDKINGGSALVALPAAEGRPSVILIGGESLISNGLILNSDNAAIALHLFGQTDRLIWYVPSLADIAATEGTSRAITPAWFQPAVALGTSAVVLLCLWRGRRLGPLVTEPLPVIVRAVETTESRARMYRHCGDRTRALAVLQQATRRRLASHLGLSPNCDVSSLAAASAAVSGREYHDVLDLLDSPTAPDDSSLLERANTLSALEKEVRGT
jgi:hypothetical protein